MKSNTIIAATFSTIGASMKRAAALVAVLTILAAGAAAQSNARMLVSVPFEFTVGKATMPAGEYVVTRRGSNVLEIRGTGTDAAAVVTTSPLAVDEAGERSQVVFNRYDNAYFLASVQTLDGSMSLKGSRSKAEQQLAKAGAPAEIVAIVATR